MICEPFTLVESSEWIADDALIRAYSRIDGRVRIGHGFETGNHTLIRGTIEIGERCRVGSYSSVEGTVTIGDDTIIRGRCEIPNSVIGSRVQIYAGTILYDTPNPPDGPNLPPVIEDDVIIGCDVGVLGGITVGAGSFVAARAFVNRSVPPGSFVRRDGTWTPRR